jgi:PAS domain S-box-containing protein
MKHTDKTRRQQVKNSKKPRARVAALEQPEAKWTGETLRKPQQLLEKTFASLLGAVFIIDADTVEITDCNPAASDIFGYSREEMLSRTTTFLHVDEAALEEFRKHLYPAVEEKGFLFLPEFRMKRKDGTVFPTEHSVMPLEDEQGKRIGWVSVVRDITVRKQAEEATAHSQRTLLALSQAAQTVQRARTPDEVYRSIGDQMVKLGYHATIFTLTEDRTHLAVPYLTFDLDPLRAAEKLAGLSTPGFRFAITPGDIYHQVITTREAVFTEQTAEHIAQTLPGPVRPLAGRIAELLGVKESIGAPLVVGGEVHGLLVVSGAGLTEADVAAVAAFANQAAIAIENARLFQQVHAGRERLRALSRRLVEMQESERCDIARELHDRIGQNLTALSINLNIVRSQLSDESARKMESRLNDSLKLLEETMERIRDVMAEMRPPVLDDYGLAAVLRWYGEQFAERTGVTTELQGEELTPRLPLAVEMTLFRITQEALTNVAKHARARQATITLEALAGGARLTIADDGVGFDLTAHHRPGARPEWGLMTMRERAEAVGGRLRVESAPGQGTRIIVEVSSLSS